MVRLESRMAPNRGSTSLSDSINTGLSEEQITDIFSSAGKVERFRLVYDSETGRPKGFGFADYPDTGMGVCSLLKVAAHEG